MPSSQLVKFWTRQSRTSSTSSCHTPPVELAPKRTPTEASNNETCRPRRAILQEYVNCNIIIDQVVVEAFPPHRIVGPSIHIDWSIGRIFHHAANSWNVWWNIRGNGLEHCRSLTPPLAFERANTSRVSAVEFFAGGHSIILLMLPLSILKNCHLPLTKENDSFLLVDVPKKLAKTHRWVSATTSAALALQLGCPQQPRTSR